MSNHTQWGHATSAVYTLHTRAQAGEEPRPEGGHVLSGPFVLGLWNDNGAGFSLCGTWRQLLDYLTRVTQRVAHQTAPRVQLDRALRRIRTVRTHHAAALEDSDFPTATRLADDEIDLLTDLVEIAQTVNDQL